VIIAQNYLGIVIDVIVGGHQGMFWVRWDPLFALISNSFIEPIRLCLLAVAFRRCLELFALRSTTGFPPPAEPESALPDMASMGVRS
jgi:hypothetical protein